jgi:ABC-type nitrate/sulfonate/bicarbonate transport system substrate-binding protein
VKDLEGQEVAAARATTNFQMFDFFAKKLGADVSKMKIVNTAPPGLVGYAVADRAAAVQLWEPAYTLLKAKKPGLRLLDLQLEKTWKTFAGGTDIPYLGIAAHTDWIEANQAVIPKLYAAYKAAGEFIVKNPEEAAKIIDAKGTPESHAALVSLIKANARLGMNVAGAASIKKQIEGVYKAGIDVGYLKKMPSNDTIYDKPLK